MPGFTHLHLHSQYSLLDGAIRLDQLMSRLPQLGMDTVAVTDHGNMFGVIDFYSRAKAAGIKPIIGCEVYVAGPKGMGDRTSREVYHLVLIARDREGYHNLCTLVSKGYLDGFYYHPRVDKDLLRKHRGGLTALSACLSGELASRIKEGRVEAAREAALEYASIFEPGQFYLEIQQNGLKEQAVVNEVLSKLSVCSKIFPRRWRTPPRSPGNARWSWIWRRSTCLTTLSLLATIWTAFWRPRPRMGWNAA